LYVTVKSLIWIAKYCACVHTERSTIMTNAIHCPKPQTCKIFLFTKFRAHVWVHNLTKWLILQFEAWVRMAIRPDTYCILYSLRESIDRNHLGQCTALLNRTERERYWEARKKIMENWFCPFFITNFYEQFLSLELLYLLYISLLNL
jgi:hypothetical protein